jgi:hypothetical protein
MVLRRLCEEEFGVTRDDGVGRAAEREATLATMRLGIAKRVIHVCAHMSSPDFDEMIASMARIQHKYEVLGSRTFGRTPAF